MRFKKVGLLFLLPLGLMVCIFLLSSQTGTNSNSVSIVLAENVMKVLSAGYDSLSHCAKVEILQHVNTIIRKTTHFMAYFVLCWLLLVSSSRYIQTIKYNIAIALSVCLVFAISDEVHQYFVIARTAKLTDVFIDISGAFLMATIYYIFHKKKVGRGSG